MIIFLSIVKLGYIELGSNTILGKNGHFSTQMNTVITKLGYSEKMVGPDLFLISEFHCIFM